MPLIHNENLSKFTDKHNLQTHGTAMGTKMAVASAVIFMAQIKKWLVATSPHKHLISKRFFNDIFSVWASHKAEINNFTYFTKLFHTIIKFKHEVSSEKIAFLDTKAFKGLRFITDKILDVQPHFKPLGTFHCTHFSCLCKRRSFVHTKNKIR